MKLIGHRGERIAGYAPALPESSLGCGEMPCPLVYKNLINQGFEKFKTRYVTICNDMKRYETI